MCRGSSGARRPVVPARAGAVRPPSTPDVAVTVHGGRSAALGPVGGPFRRFVRAAGRSRRAGPVGGPFSGARGWPAGRSEGLSGGATGRRARAGGGGEPGRGEGERGDQQGRATAGADQLGAVGAVAVGTRWRLERLHTLADVAVEFAGRHGRLLSLRPPVAHHRVNHSGVVWHAPPTRSGAARAPRSERPRSALRARGRPRPSAPGWRRPRRSRSTRRRASCRRAAPRSGRRRAGPGWPAPPPR